MASSTITPSSEEQPFKISIPDDQIELLHKKLALTVLPDELEDAGRDYGVPLADIKRLLARWQSGYDWRKCEQELNDEMPWQFQRDIAVDNFGSLKIHYIHKKSEVANAIPLLFVHGWPGSFLEVRKILPLLTAKAPDQPSFHVVAFSLPGYGFSDGSKKRGFGISKYAEVGHKLMLSLGYNEYVSQGGDWGFAITKEIAAVYGGKYNKAWHTNGPLPDDMALERGPPKLLSHPILYLRHLFARYSDADKAGFKRTAWFVNEGMGYQHEQSTQPQTLGYSVTDSPVGLLAWIYEKLVNWTDNYPWEDDEVITWVSIYWFSRAGPTAASRIYYESTHINQPTSLPPKIPHGASFFPREIDVFPRFWTRTKYRVFESQHDSGGHFAAHEKPNELVGDLRKMFGREGPAFGVVTGKTGY